MKAILLARVSTEDQTTEQQLPRLIDYAKQKGFEYTSKDIYDFSESAYKDERKEFQELIDRIKSEVETIALVTDKIDRLLRNFAKYLPIIDELRKSEKVELHFPSDNLILNASSPAIDLFKFSMGVALAQYYSDSIRDNVKRRFEQKIRKGELLTKAPYGYRNVPINEKENTVEVDWNEAQIVQKMFDLYSTNSYSERTLGKKIFELYNVKIATSQIARILSNKFYIGICYYKKKNLEYPHIYETIVSEAIFNKVQEIRTKRLQNDNKGKYAGKPFKYRNLVRCAICGYSMSPEEQRGKNYYCCTEYGGKHGAKYVSEDILTSHFAEAFEHIKLTDEQVEKIIEDLKSLNHDNVCISKSRLENLRKQQDKYNLMRSRNYDNYASDSITKELYEEKEKEYKRLLEDVSAKIKASEQIDNSFYATAKYILELAKNSGKLFEKAEKEERQILINTVLTNIRYDGKNLSYDYIEPFNLLADFSKLQYGVEDGT